MSSQENNNRNNEELNEFLNRRDSGDPAMDDFEKEALEGFEALENEEISELKSSLDKRMYQEVLNEAPKTSGRYWYAAAALLVIVGLTVVFVQMMDFSDKQELAIHSSAAEADKTELKPAPQLPVAEPAVSQEDKSSEENTKGKALEEPERKQPVKALKEEDYKADRAASLSEEPMEQETQFAPAAPPYSADKDKGQKSFENRSADTAIAMDRHVLSNGAVSITHPAYSAPVNTGVNATFNNTPTTTDDLNLVYNESKNEERLEKSSAEAEKTPKKKETLKKDKAAEAKAAEKPSALPSTASYAGGDKGLNNDLKKLLEPRQLSKKFDAVLYINKNGNVENVLITNDYGSFSESQRKELSELLKQLGKFECNDQRTKYPIKYRPEI